jgi:transcriptional regulator with XRE-family HTH domain
MSISPENEKAAFLVELGNFLKMRRLDLGKTQIEIGELVGYGAEVAKQAISQIERGVTGIPAKKTDDFIKALSLDEGVFKLINYYTSVNQYSEALKLVQSKMQTEMDTKTGKLVRVDGKMVPEKEQPQANSSGNEPDLEAKLQRLKNLHVAGLITQEDYDVSRQKLLDSFLGI